MVNKKKLTTIRRKPKRNIKAKPKAKSPNWEMIFDMGLKKEIKQEVEELGLKAWDHYQSKGNYRDKVIKFMEAQPKLSAGKMDRITQHGNKMRNHSFFIHADKHHQYAMEEVARVLSTSKHGIRKGKSGRFYAKGHRGALKTKYATDLLSEFSELQGG